MSRNKPRTPKEAIYLALKGFTMGCADLVPGVSGGTIALVTGIYDELIGAINSCVLAVKKLLQLQLKQAYQEVPFGFLIPLFLGLLTAVISMASVIKYCMDEFPEATWGLFFGLMVASILIVSNMIKSDRTPYHLSLMIMAAMFAYLISQATPTETPETFMYFFFSGMIAIVAMILPGISGSFILLILGKYMQVIGALKEVKSFNFEPLLDIVIPFALGCVVGLITFSKILNFLLREHRSLTLSILLGLMIGFLSKLWPFQIVILKLDLGYGEKMKTLQTALDWPFFDQVETWFGFIAMFIGFCLVISVDRLSNKSH